jgi:hypothetical protein
MTATPVRIGDMFTQDHFRPTRTWLLVWACVTAVVSTPTGARAGDGDSAIARYRKIWNPFSAGPELVSSADVQPQGQLFLRPYIYSELAYGQFNGWAVASAGLDRKLYSIAPHLFRKNLRPFRLSGGVYYSYGPPSSQNGVSQDYGDIFQYRFAFEQFIDDTSGFGYAVELVGIHGLPFRLDGKAIDTGRTSFGLFGLQPTIEYNFTDRIVGAAGVLVTAAGYQDVAAVYPNLSIYYYWNPRGKVVAR